MFAKNCRGQLLVTVSYLGNQHMAHDRYQVPPQKGCTAVITGTGGLGFQVALELARAGANVILAGRNAVAGERAVAEINRSVANAARFEEVDLASLSSVTNFAGRVNAAGATIDLLINNAGVMSPPIRRCTEDGFELQFGVNHLAHFALTARLLPLLRKSKAPRVVNVTSLAHRYAKIDFDDLQSVRRYRPGVAYCQSKLAQGLFAQELQRRSNLGGWGLASIAAHPGTASTNLFQNGQGTMTPLKAIGTRLFVSLFGQSAADGALPTIYAATSLDAKGGALYGPTGLFEMKGAPGQCRFAPRANDTEVASRLWNISEELAGVRFP